MSSIALGDSSNATATNSLALGVGSKATFADSTAIGAGAESTAADRITLGTGTTSIQTPSLRTQTPGQVGVIVAQPNGVLKVATFAATDLPNSYCLGAGSGATCYGDKSDATGAGTTAIGAGSVANSGAGAAELTAATAIGTFAKATGAGSTSLGVQANASGEGSISSGMNSSATGRGALAYGFAANATAENTMALGGFSTANGDNSVAIGAGALANGRRAIAFGTGAKALGFNADPIAMGTNSLSDGTSTMAYGGESTAIGNNATALGAYSTAIGVNVVAIGSGSSATFAGSTALGIGATTTRTNQVVIGTSSDEVTIPGLSGSGTALVAANDDGTLRRSSVSLGQVETAVKTTIPKLEKAARGLGRAAESAGAVGAALSGLPEVSLLPDEPARCGFAGGGFGSQYSVAGGCALRIKDRFHLNGAIAYTPSVDYEYGSTSSFAGRIGFSFPLGKIDSSDKVAQESLYGQQIAALQAEVKELRSAEPISYSSAGMSVSDPKVSAYLGEVTGVINRLEGEVESRDQQIESLTTRLEELMENQRTNAGTDAAASEATQNLIEILKAQIEELTARDSSNRDEIDNLKSQLEARDQKVNKLQRQFNAIMQKLALQSSEKL